MSELTKILEREKERAKEFKKLANIKRKEWVGSVNEFYLKIERWLTDEHSRGLVEFHRSKKYPEDEYSGSYEINVLNLGFPNDFITIDPIAWQVAGGLGRVDIYNRKRPLINFIILLKKEDGKWYVLERPDRISNEINYVELDEGKFKDILIQLIK
jgi:hypothetical protein